MGGAIDSPRPVPTIGFALHPRPRHEASEVGANGAPQGGKQRQHEMWGMINLK